METQNLQKTTGEPTASLNALVGYLCDCAGTLRELLEIIARYRTITIELAEPQLDVRDSRAYFGARFASGVPATAVEHEVVWWVTRVRKALRRDWRPVRVDLQAMHADSAEREAFFDAPVSFGSSTTGFEFEAALLDMPLAGSDPALLARLMPVANDMLRALAVGDGFVKRVRAVVTRQLEKGGASVEDVARELAVSRRTLQRRLESDGTTFGSVCDEARRAAALEHLRNPKLGIKEAAFRLGFSEPSTFYRAFRRWTGDTPANYRRSFARESVWRDFPWQRRVAPVVRTAALAIVARI